MQRISCFRVLGVRLTTTAIQSRRYRASLMSVTILIRKACRYCLLWAGVILAPLPAGADSIPTVMLDPNLQVTTFLSTGLSQPIGIVFLGPSDAFVLEKASGQVKRVIGGVLQPTPVLDLAVNSNSERGLLSLVLHPNFPTTPFVYIRWTESSTGADSGARTDLPVLRHPVDRFIWT